MNRTEYEVKMNAIQITNGLKSRFRIKRHSNTNQKYEEEENTYELTNKATNEHFDSLVMNGAKNVRIEPVKSFKSSVENVQMYRY